MKLIKNFEAATVVVLLIFTCLIIAFSLIDLAYNFIKILHGAQFLYFSNDQLIGLFGMVMVVLIGLELLETIKAYLKEDVVHAEIVVLAAIIALARKVVVMDSGSLSELKIAAIGFLFIALAAGYYMLKKAGGFKLPWKEEDERKDKTEK
ncbi:MAG TPA: phosphate-starvation-inducible PsiE family protein [Bacteroidales bacterium]|nr:phosphate-starvation-inducible PsiE family protein [Bacteroidales bacterium]